MGIADLFKHLRENPTGHAFTVVQYPGRENVYLGIDSDRRPCLFARTTELSLDPPLRTSQVSLILGRDYAVAPLGEPTRSERFHALLCETSVESDVATFLVMIEAFLAQYDEEQLSQGTIVSFFRSLRRLFSVNLSRDLQGERQGLWGELFMMSRIRGFVSWVPFWHSENNRTFDFSADSKHVEVKTAIGGERVHHFSHRQVYELAGEQTMIASLLLRKEDAGLTLQELIAQARSSLLGGEYYFKLEQAVRQAGMERTDETGPAFDAVEAEQSLSWYKATDAPHFRMPEPPGVSQTHYRVDLSIAPQVTRTELDPWLESWTTLVPNIPRRSLRPVVLRS